MKKLYTEWSKYLYNFDTGEGEGAGAGGGAAGAGGAEGAGAAAATPSQQPEGASGTVVDWRESLPEDLRGHDKIKSISSIEDLAKALVSVKEAPVVPEKMILPSGVPEELGDWAVKTGMTQTQFDAALTKFQEIKTVEMSAVVEKHKAGMNELYKVWGESKQENLNLANRVLAFADPDGKLELSKFLKSQESGYAMMNPIVVSLFYNLGKTMKESGVLKSAKPTTEQPTQKVNLAHEMYPNQAPKK